MTSALNFSNASAIEASCFNATKTEEYDDLRAMKSAATTKVQEIVRLYKELKDVPDEDIEDLEAYSRKTDYNAARGEVIADLQKWYVRTRDVIKQNPGSKPELKVKATHQYMKRVKAF